MGADFQVFVCLSTNLPETKTHIEIILVIIKLTLWLDVKIGLI